MYLTVWAGKLEPYDVIIHLSQFRCLVDEKQTGELWGMLLSDHGTKDQNTTKTKPKAIETRLVLLT